MTEYEYRVTRDLGSDGVRYYVERRPKRWRLFSGESEWWPIVSRNNRSECQRLIELILAPEAPQ
jgi:hypothetical protein